MGQGKKSVAAPLDKEQSKQLGDAHNQVDNLAPPVNGYDANQENDRLMVISFDGTWNDGNTGTVDTVNTNPANLSNLIPKDLDNVKPIYIPGVGTDGTVDKYVGGAFGEGSVQKANQAYKEFKAQVTNWHNDNPNVDIHLSTVGFSRGTGSQRHFANKVFEEGVPSPTAIPIQTNIGGGYGDSSLKSLSNAFSGAIAAAEKVMAEREAV